MIVSVIFYQHIPIRYITYIIILELQIKIYLYNKKKLFKMGNKLKQSSLFTKTAMSQIGTAATCPNCQHIFPAATTYQNFDQHVTQCLDSFRPSDQERLRMEKRKKSKDSTGSKSSEDNEDNHDYVTIQIYIKKNQSKYKIPPPSMQKKQNQNSNIMTKTANYVHIPKKSYWIKSNLTYSQSLLCSLPLNQIQSQGTAYKIIWFHHKLSTMRITWKQGAEQIMFQHGHIVRDSLRLKQLNMYKQLKITVVNDIVHDAGGLLRQWASMLLKDLIVTYGLFIRNNNGYYILNPELSTKQKLNSTVQFASNVILKQQPQSSTQTRFSQQFQMLKQYYWSQMQQKQQQQIPNEYEYDDQGQYPYQFYNQIQIQQTINPNNTTNYNKITYAQLYELFATLLAKILIEKVTVDVHFDWGMIGQILAGGNKCRDENLDRMYTYDYQLYNSLIFLLELQQIFKNSHSSSDIYKQKLTELSQLCLTFTIPSINNKPEHVLIPKGESIRVENPKQLQLYIEQFQNYYLHELHQNQISIIAQKLNSIIKPQHFKNLFSCQQFQVIINGVDGDDINIKDWQDGTHYKQPYHANHKVIKYFWATVQKMNSSNKMRLLKFVTGAQRLPIYGFKNLETNRGSTSHFVIESIKYDKKLSSFPKAHTCFNRLMLPLYPNQATLAQGLMAIVKGQFDGVWGME